MSIAQFVAEKKTDIKICPICKKELPLFTEDGKHNFCPHSTGINQIIDICIKCKVDFQHFS